MSVHFYVDQYLMENENSNRYGMLERWRVEEGGKMLRWFLEL